MVYFRDNAVTYPDDKWVLGRWLGPSIRVGPVLCAKLLKGNGQRVYRLSYQHLTEDEVNNPEEVKKRDDFDRRIEIKLGPATKLLDFDDEGQTPVFQLYEDDDDRVIDHAKETEEESSPISFDNYIGTEVTLPRGDKMVSGTVKSRVKVHEGDPIGIANRNPILDTRVYEVQFTDGGRVEFGANVIAECMYTQCDVEDKQFRLMEAIIDHKMTDDAVQKEDMYFMLRGRQHMKCTTKGWMLCVQWKDKSTSWEKLSDMKESYPVEVAEYATALGIQDEPDFAWWAKAVLQKQQRIIAAVNRQYHKTTHKFGIHVPKTIKEALDLDKENGNTLWWDAIMKEMKSVRIAFCILSKDEKPTVDS